MRRNHPRCGLPGSLGIVGCLVLVAASGCTMCPDPYDYSGPVPNGTAPQNDFRARSNGILPLGAAPKPWPPVVEREEQPGVPTEADGMDAVTASAELDDPIAEPTADDLEPAAEGSVAAEDEAPAVAGGIDVLPAVVEEPVADILPPASPRRSPLVPPLRETPGWRPRG